MSFEPLDDQPSAVKPGGQRAASGRMPDLSGGVADYDVRGADVLAGEHERVPIGLDRDDPPVRTHGSREFAHDGGGIGHVLQSPLDTRAVNFAVGKREPVRVRPNKADRWSVSVPRASRLEEVFAEVNPAIPFGPT